MAEDNVQQEGARATVRAPNFFEGLAQQDNDVCLHQRHYTYKTESGLVSGCVFSVMFTVERPVKDVWPYFRDFNRWQNAYGLFYSDVVADLYSEEDLGLGHGILRIARGADAPPHPYHYEVLRVIPEHLILLYQPIHKGSLGDVSPGVHAFMLNEHGAKTVVTVVMEHAFRANDKSEEEALAYWRGMAEEIQSMWRDSFVPTLKRAIYDGR